MGNYSNQVCLFDFEFGKLIQIFELPPEAYTTSLSFFHSVPVFIIGSSEGKVYMIKFEKKDLNFEFKIVLKLDLEKNNKNYVEKEKSIN